MYCALVYVGWAPLFDQLLDTARCVRTHVSAGAKALPSSLTNPWSRATDETQQQDPDVSRTCCKTMQPMLSGRLASAEPLRMQLHTSLLSEAAGKLAAACLPWCQAQNV